MSDERQPVERQVESMAEARSAAAADPDVFFTDQQLLDAVVQQNKKLLESQSFLSRKVNMLEIALKKARHDAFYDELTGLPNRRLLLDRFTQAVALAQRNRRLLAMLFFDLNDFKSVNDRFGHDAGDMLLQQVAERLVSAIRRSDTVCRLGGDEFVVLMPEMRSREQVLKKLNAIRVHLLPSYSVCGHSLRQSASIGSAIYPDDSEDLSELLRLSDRSMFSDKVEARAKTPGARESRRQRNKYGVVTRIR